MCAVCDVSASGCPKGQLPPRSPELIQSLLKCLWMKIWAFWVVGQVLALLGIFDFSSPNCCLAWQRGKGLWLNLELESGTEVVFLHVMSRNDRLLDGNSFMCMGAKWQLCHFHTRPANLKNRRKWVYIHAEQCINAIPLHCRPAVIMQQQLWAALPLPASDHTFCPQLLNSSLAGFVFFHSLLVLLTSKYEGTSQCDGGWPLAHWISGRSVI